MDPLIQGSAILADIFGGTEMMLILVVVLIFFGGEKMPAFARGLGKAIREIRKAAGDVEQEFKRVLDESEKQAPLLPKIPTPKDVIPRILSDDPPASGHSRLPEEKP
jgi:sec-independent protein translocase protein TatA